MRSILVSCEEILDISHCFSKAGCYIGLYVGKIFFVISVWSVCGMFFLLRQALLYLEKKGMAQASNQISENLNTCIKINRNDHEYRECWILGGLGIVNIIKLLNPTA